LPALARVAETIRQHAPGRNVEAFGLPTLPAALAFGCAFLSTSGLRVSWRQITPGRPDQLWTLLESRQDSGFQAQIVSKNPAGRDLAVLVSVADNAEPVFTAFQKELPLLRALVHITKSGSSPHLLRSPGEASDIAFVVQDGMRAARRQYGNVATVHLFMAAPAGLAMLVGQLLNTFGTVQTYEHVGTDGSGCYKPAALLRPCAWNRVRSNNHDATLGVSQRGRALVNGAAKGVSAIRL
jgi:SMODS-associated and fused to various effectors sensor domain